MADYATFLNGSTDVHFSETYAFKLDQDAKLHFSGHVLINGKNFWGQAAKDLVKGTHVVLYQDNTCRLELTTKETPQ